MERERGTKILAIVAICIAVIGMTVGFATLTITLRIEGEAEVKGSKFSVIFADLQSVVETGSANEVTAPTIQTGNTTISNYQVELTAPGDIISYTFKIQNQGTYDAEISSITMAGLETTPFEVTGLNETDENKVKSKLSYTLTYVGGAKDGQALAIGDSISKKVGENPGEVTVKLTLAYADFEDAADLPENTVTIDNLGIDINYVQA